MPDASLTKESLDVCLKELAKEYRRLVGKGMPAELILVGGAAVLANYGFRDSTYDIDAVIHAASAMRDAISRVGDRMNFPRGWLNDDFLHTKSFSPKLAEFSVYYKTFSNVLSVRTVSGEYLVAMKLMSARQYKNDLSDIIGILWEHQKAGRPLALEQIKKAVETLYGDWSAIPQNAQQFLCAAVRESDYGALFASAQREEQRSHALLRVFDEKYPQVLKEANLAEILDLAKKRRHSRSER